MSRRENEGWCRRCRKRPYTTLEYAQRCAERWGLDASGTPMAAYPCPHWPGRFHIGHDQGAVRNYCRTRNCHTPPGPRGYCAWHNAHLPLTHPDRDWTRLGWRVNAATTHNRAHGRHLHRGERRD